MNGWPVTPPGSLARLTRHVDIPGPGALHLTRGQLVRVHALDAGQARIVVRGAFNGPRIVSVPRESLRPEADPEIVAMTAES